MYASLINAGFRYFLSANCQKRQIGRFFVSLSSKSKHKTLLIFVGLIKLYRMKKVLICLLLVSIFSTGWSQVNKKTLSEAERFYGIKAYDQALPLFLEVVQAGEKDPMVHYKTGVCYQKSFDTNEQLKAIPFLEFAVEKATGLPNAVYYELGELQLKDENIQKALNHFNRYKDLTKADKLAQAKAIQAIDMCHTATGLMSVPRNIKVNN
jgi:hypothetical protein